MGNIHADMKEPSEVGNSKQKGIRRISLQRFTAYNRGYTFQIANPYKKGDTTGVQHDDHEMGNSQGIRIPAQIMREKMLKIGDRIEFDTSRPDEIVITISKTSDRQLKAAGILSRYAKGKPDMEAEQSAIRNAILEKHAKDGKS